PMIASRALLDVLGATALLTFGTATVAMPTTVAIAAPDQAQSNPDGGVSVPNPLAPLTSMLSPANLGKLIQDTVAYLLKQMVNGLHDLLVTLTQGNDNVITHTPA